MSTVQEQRRIHLEAKAVADLKGRLAKQAYMSILDVSKHMNVSREKVESLPKEVLPYRNFGAGRMLRRYHPADVLAVPARMRRRQARRLPPPKGYVYLIEAPSVGLVKIGHSIDVAARFRGIETMSPVPLRLVRSWPGSPKDERRLHERLAHLRSHGEWFQSEAIDLAEAVMHAMGGLS